MVFIHQHIIRMQQSPPLQDIDEVLVVEKQWGGIIQGGQSLVTPCLGADRTQDPSECCVLMVTVIVFLRVIVLVHPLPEAQASRPSERVTTCFSCSQVRNYSLHGCF